MKLDELLSLVEYNVVSGAEKISSTEIGDVTDVSGECVEGSLFVCIEGARSDGHDFVVEAVKNGASAVMCAMGRGGEIRGITASFGDACVIETEDTRSAYAKLCGMFFGVYSSSVRMICVTGTNGKTSVSSMIRNALCFCGKRAALLGTLGGSFEGKEYSCGTMTTPDPKRLYYILSEFIGLGAEYIVMEASSHALALKKLDGLRVHMGVFTNLTPEHLDFHGSMEEYARAKALLFGKCANGAVFFSDDPYCGTMIKALPVGVRYATCSLTEEIADYKADCVELLGENGVRFTVNTGIYRAEAIRGERIHEIKCGCAGVFSVYNSLLAFATLCELGIEPRLAREGIAAFHGVRGRMERVEAPPEREITVFIDFAHTPDALSKLIRSVRAFCGDSRRIVTLFGCGGDRDKSKRSLMGAISSRLSDLTVITSDNSRSESVESIIRDILTGVDKERPFVVIPNRKEAIEYVLGNSGKGDVILLCGKGHEEYEISGGVISPFSERRIIEEFFEGMEKQNAR